MRQVAVAALAFALAACGGGDGDELAAGNSQLNEAQIDAALGPANQSAVQDGIPSSNAQEASVMTRNEGVTASEEEDAE